MAQYLKVLLLSILWVLLFNCSSTSSDSTTSGSNNLDLATIGSNVTALDLSGSTTTLTIENPSVDDDFILVVYATQDDMSSAQFALSAGLTQTTLDTALQATSTTDSHESTDFHTLLRAYEKTLSADQKILQSGWQASSRNELVVGDTDTFYVMNSLSDLDATTTVHATIVYQDDAFNFFVDNTALESMSEANLTELCENFSNVIDDMHANFGHESDINGDGRFDILATPVVNQLTELDESMTTGFFFAKDLYAVDGSNEREIFYTAVPDPTGEYGFVLSEDFAFSNILPSTLPHEFQHMINHNERVFELGAVAEDQWLNEALSHLAEDVYSINADGYMTQTGIENPARIELYLDEIADVCFVCTTDLAGRGGSYLFLRTLYEFAEQGEFSGVNSGREFLQHLVQSTKSGKENVTQAVFGDEASEGDFQDLLGQFALQVYFNRISGVDLLTYQNDNRHTSLQGVNLQVMADDQLTVTIIGQVMFYVQIQGADLVANVGELVLNYGDGHFSGFLIGE